MINYSSVLLVTGFCLFLQNVTAEPIAVTCSHEKDCLPNFQRCKFESGNCERKRVVPFYWEEGFGTILLACEIAVSNAGGIGGGESLLPTFSLFFYFRNRAAVALNSCIIFVAALTRFLIYLKTKHPESEKRVLIDYNIAAVLLPMTLFGSRLGVFINATFPEAVIIILQTILLICACVYTFRLARRFQKQEKARRAAQRGGQDSLQPERESKQNQLNQSGMVRIINPKYQRILKFQNTHYPPKKLLLMLGMLFSLFIISLLRGSRGKSLASIQNCSAGDWSLLVLLLLITIAFQAFTTLHIVSEQRIKENNNYPFQDSDIKWTHSKVIKLSLASLGAGTLATSVGIGGGIIYNPILMSIGVPPMVSAATVMYVVMYRSLASFLQFIILDRIMYDYALWLGFWVVVATSFGLVIVNRKVEKSGNQSLVVYILAGLILCGSILTPSLASFELRNSKHVWTFQSFCDQT